MGGQATAAELSVPAGVSFDVAGNMYIADDGPNVIRKVTTAGVISTVVGNGTSGFSGDGGQATAAELEGPGPVVFDATGNMYVPDGLNNRIRKVTTAGIISTIAGNGTNGYSGDGGQATAAELNGPDQMACDAIGNLYIGDNSNHRVRKITTAGIISTIAGNGTFGFSGDGGQATAAELYFPNFITLDVAGNIYIDDSNNNRIRKINTAGVISTFAGGGSGGLGDGGQATAAELGRPTGINFDAAGNFYIADSYNQRIRAMGSCLANAGTNKTNSQDGCGLWTPGVTIGTAASGKNYSWLPTTNLSPTNTATATSTYSTTMSTQTITYTLSVSYSLCVTATSTVQVTAVKSNCAPGCCRMAEGISAESKGVESFVVYPNPTTGKVTLSLYDKADYIQLIDMQGRLVFETKNINAQEFKLDISKYTSGIYFIRAKIGDTIEKQKLVIE
jgi:hypothetical protein